MDPTSTPSTGTPPPGPVPESYTQVRKGRAEAMRVDRTGEPPPRSNKLVVGLITVSLLTQAAGFVAINGRMLDIQREIGELRAEMHREIGELRAEMHREIGGLRAEMHREIGKFRAEMYRELRALSERVSRIETILLERYPDPGEDEEPADS